MPSYFLDSSAMVKRYAVEVGTAWVFAVLRPSAGNTIFVARITGVETVSALARKRKGNHLTRDQAAKAITRFEKHFIRRYQKASVTDDIITTAMRLAGKYDLRGYDAVQLAAALHIEHQRRALGAAPLVFVSADADLNLAAHAEGLTVDNPNQHP